MLKSGLVYSIGSANQFSFERGIRRSCFNCKIHTFDGTVCNPKVPTALRGLSFHSWNIASEPSNGSKVISKSPKETLAEVHGTPNVTLEVLKMDLKVASSKSSQDCLSCLQATKYLLKFTGRRALQCSEDF
jgi:hypothetical protein